MRVTVNGNPRKAPDGASVSDLLGRMRVRKTEVAVMVNGRVVRRASHANTKLNEGDSIEVVSYAGGG